MERIGQWTEKCFYMTTTEVTEDTEQRNSDYLPRARHGYVTLVREEPRKAQNTRRENERS